jgi:hypothetical protein
VRRFLVCAAAVLVLVLSGIPARAEERLEFEPKVGAVGGRVVVKAGVPAGAQLLIGGKPVGVVKEADGVSAFIVPPGLSSSAFLEIVSGGRTISKSAVPFIISGASLAAPRSSSASRRRSTSSAIPTRVLPAARSPSRRRALS